MTCQVVSQNQSMSYQGSLNGFYNFDIPKSENKTPEYSYIQQNKPFSIWVSNDQEFLKRSENIKLTNRAT